MNVNFSFLLSLFLSHTTALDNGVGILPAMGYNSWYDLQGSINESILKLTVDKMVSLNLPQLGYTYFNLDDDWAIGRDPTTGALIADPSRFTGGSLKSLADYVHSKGLKFGTYTDRGNLTCGGKPGALNHEIQDALTYADWGVDYLKEDSCDASSDHDTAFHEYSKMTAALNATGRPILFSLCGWNSWYAPKGQSLGNSWRIGPDDTNWAGVLTNININADLSEYAGHGGFNDPCLLLAEDDTGKQRITELQSRFQFSFWAVMTSPLLISGNIRNMSAMNIETYSNADVIAVNQDSLAKQGIRITGGQQSSSYVWSKPLANGDIAVAFGNIGSKIQDVVCDKDCWFSAWFFSISPLGSQHSCAKDLWTGVKVSVGVNGFTAQNLPAEGGITFLRVSSGAC